ncbi:hypothetical protein BG004_003708 [Podila humilis]|nr:hypothetical protein BG004_003708 [Podila humilis]
MSSQGASLLAGSHMDDGHAFEESTGLLMEVFDSNSHHDLPNNSATSGSPAPAPAPAPAARASLPHKARSSEDAGHANAIHSSFSPVIRSGFMGNQNHGRQRTSDRYESVPTSEADHHR